MTLVRHVSSALLLTAAMLALLPTRLAAAGANDIAESLSAADANLAATVVVYGKAASKRRNAVRNAVEEALRDAGWNLERPFSRRESAAVARCFAADKPGLCIASAAAKNGVGRVVAVQVDPERGKSSRAPLRLSGQLAAAGDDDVVLQLRFCNPCGKRELPQAAQELVKLLLENSQVRAATTKIALRTKPAGVVVTVDGKLIGGESSELVTVAGSHTLLFELDGYTRQTRTVEALEGQTVTVEVELSPSAGIVIAPVEPRPTRDGGGDDVDDGDAPRPGGLGGAKSDASGGITVISRGNRDRDADTGRGVLPYAVIGLGVVAIGAGVAGILLDEDPVADPGVKQPATILDTERLGIGLAIGGGVTTVLGSYLWVRAGNRASAKRSRAALAPLTISPTRRGALVGLGGSF